MLSEIAAASDSTVTPVPEKKLRWVKTGSPAKSWAHSKTPHTISCLIVNWSRLIVNLSPKVTGPRMATAVNWKTRAKSRRERLCTTRLDTIHTLYRWRRTRKKACEEQKVRTFPMSGKLLVEVRSSSLCSCTSDWYSDLQASISAPLTQPFSRNSSNNMSISCMVHGCMIVYTNQKKRAETTQCMAYYRPSGNSWQHTVHGIFEKLPAVSPELLL